MVECYLHTISPPAELSKLRIFIPGQCLQHMKKHSFSFNEKDLRCFTYMWTSWWERSRERVIQRRPDLALPPLWPQGLGSPCPAREPGEEERECSIMVGWPTSINSKPMESTHRSGKLRTMMAFPHHPRVCAITNSSNSVSCIMNHKRIFLCCDLERVQHIIHDCGGIDYQTMQMLQQSPGSLEPDRYPKTSIAAAWWACMQSIRQEHSHPPRH
jgi:hypothetical protein